MKSARGNLDFERRGGSARYDQAPPHPRARAERAFRQDAERAGCLHRRTALKTAVLEVQEVRPAAGGRAVSRASSRGRSTCHDRDRAVRSDRYRYRSRVVSLTGMFTGMVLALQSAAATLDVFGARPVRGTAGVRFHGARAGARADRAMVTGRVGSGMAAELGSMVVTQQIDALRVLGTDPVRKLVAPRLAAGLVMVPILTMISDSLGIFGGGLISVFSLKLSWRVTTGARWGRAGGQRHGDGPEQADRVRVHHQVGRLLHGAHDHRRHAGRRPLHHALGGGGLGADPRLRFLHDQGCDCSRWL